MSDTPSAPRTGNLPLIISLCINLLLAGVIAIPLVRFAMHGPYFGGRMEHDALGPGPERAQMHQMLNPRALLFAAPDKSDQIRAVLRAHHDRVAQLRAQSMAARRKVIETFSAPQFDKAAFEKSLADMQAADIAFEGEILKVVSETAGMLSPEERRRAAAFHPRPEMFRDRGHGWGRGDRERGDSPPPRDPPPDEPPPHD